ncbi:protein of unknown function [Pararobbsia alpina]
MPDSEFGRAGDDSALPDASLRFFSVACSASFARVSPQLTTTTIRYDMPGLRLTRHDCGLLRGSGSTALRNRWISKLRGLRIGKNCRMDHRAPKLTREAPLRRNKYLLFECFLYTSIQGFPLECVPRENT